MPDNSELLAPPPPPEGDMPLFEIPAAKPKMTFAEQIAATKAKNPDLAEKSKKALEAAAAGGAAPVVTPSDPNKPLTDIQKRGLALQTALADGAAKKAAEEEAKKAARTITGNANAGMTPPGAATDGTTNAEAEATAAAAAAAAAANGKPLDPVEKAKREGQMTGLDDHFTTITANAKKDFSDGSKEDTAVKALVFALTKFKLDYLNGSKDLESLKACAKLSIHDAHGILGRHVTFGKVLANLALFFVSLGIGYITAAACGHTWFPLHVENTEEKNLNTMLVDLNNIQP